MCSNITYIFMTLNRYMLIGKEHSPALTRLSEVKLKQILKLTVMFSCIVNIGHIFQYYINTNIDLRIRSPFMTQTYEINPEIYKLSIFSSFT
jgi:hypothetical protein